MTNCDWCFHVLFKFFLLFQTTNYTVIWNSQYVLVKLRLLFLHSVFQGNGINECCTSLFLSWTLRKTCN